MAFARQNMFISHGVQIIKAVRKFQLLSVNSDGAKSPLSCGLLVGRKVLSVNREKPSYARIFKLEKSRRLVGLMEVHYIGLHLAKNIQEHVEEMNPYVSGDASRLLQVPFPRHEIPGSAAGDVGQVDIILF